MRVLFMGTPGIASHILKDIASVHEVAGVFCQPDKPVGRKALLTPPPVKVTAGELGIDVYQALKMRDGTAVKIVRDINPDVIVVVAYGRILPLDILEMPKFGCVNIHVSLLPKYRGAAPIQHAILNGETETGVTAMYMSEGMDEGDIIEQDVFAISDDDDALSIFEKSALRGGKLILKVLADIENSKANRIPQGVDGISLAPQLTKEMARFSFEESAERIFNKVRALCVWPVAEFYSGGKRIKVLKAKRSSAAAQPGKVISISPLVVGTAEGSLELTQVKPEGSRAMSGTEWAAGRRLKPGDQIV